MTRLVENDRAALTELAPVLRRAIGLAPRTLVRIRLHGSIAAVLVRLPFGVLVSRAVEVPSRPEPVDVVVRAAEALEWFDGESSEPPAARDAEWRTGLPPNTGWTRLETVPDDVLRPLVRSGAMALKDAAAREGVPGAQPRAEVADALLDAAVLTVTGHGPAATEVTLRAVSPLTRMGFLRRGGAAHIDIAGRWTRIVAEYGTVYLERPGSALTLR